MNRHVFPQRNEPFGILVGQWPKQHRVDDTEDRRVRADTQGQSDDRNEANARVLQQHAHAVTQILEESVHGFYSYLSATIGSTFAARRAGIQHASKATTASSKGTAANVNGSTALTPNSNEVIKRVSANDAAKPIATPSNVNFIPFCSTSNRILAGVAPSASRTPISFLCCATKYAS